MSNHESQGPVDGQVGSQGAATPGAPGAQQVSAGQRAAEPHTPAQHMSEQHMSEQHMSEQHAHLSLLEHAENVVTKVIDRVPRPGAAEHLELAIHDLTRAAMRFPGHLGVHVTPPAPPFHPGYRLVYKFDTPEHLHAWEESEEQHRLVRAANQHTQGAPGYQVLTGLETWFTLPASPHLPPPPRSKMSVVSWLGIYPLVVGYGWIVGHLVPHETPPILRLLIVTALVVPTMSYVVGPRLTRLFKGWLYPRKA